MGASLESSAGEIARLRECLNDVVSLMALPALWAGSDPPHIVGTMLDALIGMLPLAFAFVRLNDPMGGRSIELARFAEPVEGAPGVSELGRAIDSSLAEAPLRSRRPVRMMIDDWDLAVAAAPLGLQAEIGIIVAGSANRDFPAQTDRLLLDLAANQAAIGLQQARLLAEQKRLADELDERVARRTNQLALANELLKQGVADRRRTVEALRESERESRLIVDSIPGLVALLTANGEIEVVNPQVCEYFGQTLDELRQWGTNGTIHPDDLPHVVEVFTHSIASGTPYEIVQRFRRSDGRYRWFANRGFPLCAPDGRIVRWCVLLTDIDERKRAEDALRASERDLQLIIDSIPALAWSARPDGSAEFFNRHYLDFVGLSAEQASDWGWTAAVHPDDVNALVAVWQRALLSEQPGETETRFRNRAGEYRWFLFRINPLRDDQGAILKWYGVNTDIEDRKRAEAELQRAYDSFADAQRLSRTGSFITDLLADEHHWSEEAFRIFEFEPGTEVTVQRIRGVVHPDDLESFDSLIGRGALGADVNFVFRIITARGGMKHVRGLVHVDQQSGGPPKLVGALQDVTETTVAEEALTRARAELAHVARVTSLSSLTASIAHEVNQPLSGIITNASTCLRMLDADPPDVDGARETARRTIRDGNRASQVITRLRALFTKKEFTLEPLDLNEAAREVIALSLSELQRHRVVVQPELGDNLPSITGDRVQLQQVILNLLRNAADAMAGVDDRPRSVVIRTEREDGGGVRVTVRDTGIGIEREVMDKLFDAFYTTKSGGMGIGLSVSRSIVERHRGRLWVEPNDGPGTTFAFAIPESSERLTDVAPRSTTD